MTSRRVVLAAVFLVVALAGCLGPFGGSGLDDGDLDRPANYAWDTDADAHVRVEVGEYYAVYDLDDQSTIELSQSTYYQDRAVDIEAVRYRFPDGTQLKGSELDIDQSRSTTTIEVPDGNGTLAFSAASGSKGVLVPGLVDGRYVVELPSGHRVDNRVLSNVRPSADSEELVDNRPVLTWDDHDGDIRIQFHLARDHYLFWGIVLGAIGLAAGGTLYYRRQIRQLAERRRRLAERYDE